MPSLADHRERARGSPPNWTRPYQFILHGDWAAQVGPQSPFTFQSLPNSLIASTTQVPAPRSWRSPHPHRFRVPPRPGNLPSIVLFSPVPFRQPIFFSAISNIQAAMAAFVPAGLLPCRTTWAAGCSPCPRRAHAPRAAATPPPCPPPVRPTRRQLLSVAAATIAAAAVSGDGLLVTPPPAAASGDGSTLVESLGEARAARNGLEALELLAYGSDGDAVAVADMSDLRGRLRAAPLNRIRPACFALLRDATAPGGVAATGPARAEIDRAYKRLIGAVERLDSTSLRAGRGQIRGGGGGTDVQAAYKDAVEGYGQFMAIVDPTGRQ